MRFESYAQELTSFVKIKAPRWVNSWVWTCDFLHSSDLVAHGKDLVENEVRMYMHA